MKQKQLRQEEAVARNEKHRAKYVAQYFQEHPKAEGTPEAAADSKAYADRKIGIPTRRSY
jgi:hypothetical protein